MQLAKKGKRDSPNYSWKAINNLNLDYATVFSQAPYINEDVITIIGVCFLIGAMAKSAQVGGDKKISRPIKVNNEEFIFNSILLYAWTFSNAWESEGYLNLLAFSLILLNSGIYLYLVNTYCLLTSIGARARALLLIGRGRIFFEQLRFATKKISQLAYGYSNKQAVLFSNSSKVNYIKRYSVASPLRACHSMPSYYYPPGLGIIRCYSTTPAQSEDGTDQEAAGTDLALSVISPYPKIDHLPLSEARHKKEANKIQLNKWTEGIVVGLLLSGAKFNYSGKTSLNVRLVVGLPLGEATQKYIWLIFLNLSAFCSSYPTYYKTQIYLYSRALPCFNRLYHFFYKSKNERVMPASYEILYELLTPVALAFWLMGSGVFLPSGVVLFTFSYNYNDVLRLMNILILRYNLSCTMGRYEGKPVIFIPGESIVKLLADLINFPTLFILVQKQGTDTFNNKLFIYDPKFITADQTGNPWQLLNTTGGVVSHHSDSIIFNIESLYNRYSNSTPEKFPRQGNNQQNKKLINLSMDPSVTSSNELFSEIIVIAQDEKYHRYNRAFIEW
jgi:hypothetical protein